MMKDLTTQLFPPKALQRQKIYLHMGLYKPCNTKMRKFIWSIYDIVK